MLFQRCTTWSQPSDRVVLCGIQCRYVLFDSAYQKMEACLNRNLQEMTEVMIVKKKQKKCFLQCKRYARLNMIFYTQNADSPTHLITYSLYQYHDILMDSMSRHFHKMPCSQTLPLLISDRRESQISCPISIGGGVWLQKTRCSDCHT